MTKGVYLLHFSPSYKHAKHYIGFSPNIERRIKDHISGNGGRLPQVAALAGCTIMCVRMWPGKDRTFERRSKNRKDAPRLCPICSPRSAYRYADL